MTYIVLKAPLNSNQPTNHLWLSDWYGVCRIRPIYLFECQSNVNLYEQSIQQEFAFLGRLFWV